VSDIRHSSRLRAEPVAMPKIGRSEQTRAEILDTAFEFLWSNPFRDMTVNSLMAATTVSRSAFYQYFHDVHELMETLLTTLEAEILDGARTWLQESGDPVALLHESLTNLVAVCYRRGPFLKAIADAATTDDRLEKVWNEFLGRFDDAVSGRIAADQEQGLISNVDPRAMAIALNRMDAYTFIQSFGRRPRSQPEPVLEAITRLWISALYGEAWVEGRTSTLLRDER
jgi:AcrR family transcriptional regulator